MCKQGEREEYTGCVCSDGCVRALESRFSPDLWSRTSHTRN